MTGLITGLMTSGTTTGCLGRAVHLVYAYLEGCGRAGSSSELSELSEPLLSEPLPL